MSVPEEYYRAGRIASEVREDAKIRLRVGTPLLEFVDMVEGMIRNKGAQPAFPCNICINSTAAHFTPSLSDSLRISDGDVVKVDIGVHLDGYLVDTATTVSFSPDCDVLVQTANDMLEEALRTIRSGIRAGEIGRSIQTVATRMNLKPIANLTGHTIERYTVHAGTSLPNIYTSGTPALKAGQICAIEPFVTTNHGAGVVVNGKTTNIFSLIARKRTGDKKLDTFLEGIWNRVKTLPFALRHLEGLCESRELESLVLRLVEKRVLRGYAVLVEAKGEFVAQAEHTVVPVEGGAIVLTK